MRIKPKVVGSKDLRKNDDVDIGGYGTISVSEAVKLSLDKLTLLGGGWGVRLNLLGPLTLQYTLESMWQCFDPSHAS